MYYGLSVIGTMLYIILFIIFSYMAVFIFLSGINSQFQYTYYKQICHSINTFIHQSGNKCILSHFDHFTIFCCKCKVKFEVS